MWYYKINQDFIVCIWIRIVAHILKILFRDIDILSRPEI